MYYSIRDTETSTQEWNDKENPRLSEVEQKKQHFSICADYTRYTCTLYRNYDGLEDT